MNGVRAAFVRGDVGYDVTGTQVGYRCGTCRSWNPDETCAVVVGRLRAGDCCNLWSRSVRTELPVKIGPANAVVVTTDEPSHACGICAYWQAPRGCVIVSGQIDPRASCVLWTDRLPREAGGT